MRCRVQLCLDLASLRLLILVCAGLIRMLFLPLTPDYRRAAARFLSRLNPQPEHQICYLGLAESEIAAELSAVLPPDGYSLGALDEAGRLVGFLGVEMDPSLGRAWLFGPFAEAAAWQAVADQLYQAALELVPPEIVDQELCGRLENIRLAEFARRHGFRAGSPAASLGLPRPAEPKIRPGASGRDIGLSQVGPGFPSAQIHSDPITLERPVLDAADREAAHLIAEQLDALHNSLFPNTYFSAAQLVVMSADADKRLQIELVDGQLAGYIFVQTRPSSQDAYIDFLGVAEPYRRRGIARRLLANSLEWAFARPSVERVTLTVHTANTAAIALYESAGFHTLHAMIGYRKRPHTGSR